MPGRVVIVHDNAKILDPLTDALKEAGHGVAAFDDAMNAWHALGEAKTVEVLITHVRFGRGKPHGLALVLRTRSLRPQLKVIFIGPPRSQDAFSHIGEFVPTPVEIPMVVETVERLLA